VVLKSRIGNLENSEIPFKVKNKPEWLGYGMANPGMGEQTSIFSTAFQLALPASNGFRGQEREVIPRSSDEVTNTSTPHKY
jgi:hypothetical protein